ncbi:MAG: protoporphyrinogen oxidase [Acidobacteria bacterium]|nr:protoporphyrinogen oxidase [Acidobacteriota bacterium]
MDEVAVAVVGGGITGLAAAHELHRRRVPFALFEGAPRLGGMIRTESAGGFTIDAGPDSLLVHKPAALALCRAVGLGPRLVPTLPPRAAYVLRRGRLRPLARGSVLGIPTGPGPLARNGPLSWRGRLRMALDLTLPARDAGDESVAAFFRRRFGQEAVDFLAEPLLAGIHAGEVERLSVRALFPTLVEAERNAGSVIRGLRRQRARRARGGPDEGPFRSLPGGLGELVTAVAGRLPPAAVRCGSPVRAIEGSGPFRMALDGGRIAARQVILAVPARAAAALLAPLDARAAQLAAAIRHTSSATVTLAWPRRTVGRPIRGSGFVVPWIERVSGGLAILAGTSISSKWPGRSPDGQALFRGFVGGARDPGALARTDEDLVDAVHRDLARVLAITGAPTLARVYRWPDANPQHEVGHLATVAAIDARLARLRGLHLAGAAFRGVGIPDCIAAGQAAAAAAAEAARGAPRDLAAAVPAAGVPAG